MRTPGSQILAGPSAPVAPHSVVLPTPVDSPSAAEPSEKQAFFGPLQMLFWGLAASIAIGVTIARKRVFDRQQHSGGTEFTGTDNSLELGNTSFACADVGTSLDRRGRMGVPAMVALPGVFDDGRNKDSVGVDIIKQGISEFRNAFVSGFSDLRDLIKIRNRASEPPAPPPAQPGSLILVRHGQSAWNDENRFTGWANVPLTDKGREEARAAAEILLSEVGLEIDVCYTSVLSRSVETATICLDAWERAGRRRPETFARWRLNERHYGILTGLNKREALGKFPASDLKSWRSSFQGKPPEMEPTHPEYSRTEERYERMLAARTRRPHESQPTYLDLEDVPLTESLADTRDRVDSLWQSELQPQIRSGKNVLIVGHANCLRALISCLQKELNDDDLPSLGVPNAAPLVYQFDEDGAL